jgi:hypothetical protein
MEEARWDAAEETWWGEVEDGPPYRRLTIR